MTAPLLATRDALARVLHDATCPEDHEHPGSENLRLSDALLASGVVRDPAALVEKWERRSASVVAPSEYSTAFDDGMQHAAAELRAVLTEDPS